MAAVIDATVGGVAANAYVSEAEAITYFEARTGGAAWIAATTDERVRALITATSRLDQEDFHGGRATLEQALRWPRYGAEDADDIAIDIDVIPREIKDATCELALAMLSGDLLADTGLEAFENVKIGPLEVTPRQGRSAGALPANARRLLAHLLETASGANFRLVRG